MFFYLLFCLPVLLPLTIQLTLLVLLCEWLHECPELMVQTFNTPNFLPFLLGLASIQDQPPSSISSSSDTRNEVAGEGGAAVNGQDTTLVQVRGLATYAVALCLDLFAADNEKPSNSSNSNSRVSNGGSHGRGES